MTNLTKLIARVEALTKADRETDIQIAVALIDAKREKNWYHWQANRPRGTTEGTPEEYWRSRHDRCPAFTASLDAAIALTERVLPGWSWEARRSGTGDKGQATVWNPLKAPGHSSEQRTFNRPTTAIALVLATLKALQARERVND